MSVKAKRLKAKAKTKNSKVRQRRIIIKYPKKLLTSALLLIKLSISRLVGLVLSRRSSILSVRLGHANTLPLLYHAIDVICQCHRGFE